MVMVTKRRVKVIEGKYEGGLKSGRWVYRDQKGRKTQDGTYHQDKKHGLWLIWENGQFDHQELWRAGKMTAKGNPLLDLGEPEAVRSFSCPDGAKQVEKSESEATFRWCERKGVKHGPTVGWLPSGQVVLKGAFEDGKEQGVSAMWLPSGQILALARYNQGGMDGVVTNWHDNGIRAGMTTYDSGLQVGEYREWDPSGTLVVQGEYVTGKKNGLWHQDLGPVVNDQVWERGKLVSGIVSGRFGAVPVATEYPEVVAFALERMSGTRASLERFVARTVAPSKKGRSRGQRGRKTVDRDQHQTCSNDWPRGR